MRRRFSIVALAVLAGLAFISEGKAQYGWGGWGGGATVQGTRAYGMGNFAAGAGAFNEQTAQARSVNTNTAMQLNEYLYQSKQVSKQNYYNKVADRERLNKQARDEIQDRHLNNPSETDITDGIAVNAVYDWLTNPQIPHSILVEAGEGLTLNSEEVRTIPLSAATQGIVISLERLASEDWPDELSTPEFKPDRDQYLALVQQAKAIPDGEYVPDELIDQGINVLQHMRGTARSRLSGPDAIRAENYLKGHVGLLQMTRKNNIREILEKVREVKEVPLVNALNFMQAYNLQFGKAEAVEERALYLNSLYPKLAELRARVMNSGVGTAPVPQPTGTSATPTAIFSDMPWEAVTGRGAPATR